MVGRITSHSMAPHLLGPHYAVTCTHCGGKHSIALTADTASEFVCSQCGTLQERDPQLKPQLGDQVQLRSLVNKTPNSWNPKRFDVVVVSTADERSSEFALSPDRQLRVGTIKRVIGLPGEPLQFRYGDLFVDGQLVQKSWTDQLRQGVLVHRDQTRVSPIGWQSEGPVGWSRHHQGWIHRNPVQGKAGRLVYRHRRCVLTSQNLVPEAPIEDTLTYSQGRARRLNPVSDLIIRGRVKLTPKSRLYCDLKTGAETIRVQWDTVSSQLQVDVPGRSQSISTPVALPDGEGLEMAISSFDRKVTVVHGDEIVLEADFSDVDYTSRREDYSSQPVNFHAEGDVELSALSIFRDLHLVGPYGDEIRWELGRRLESDEYFLIGDHLAESIDSRTSGRGWSRSEMIAWVRQ